MTEQTTPTDFARFARSRYDRGMRRPQSRAWYRAMAIRLHCASLEQTTEGRYQALQDRANECRYLAAKR